MLCNVSHVGVRYDSDSLYALVMISNEAKLVDHCPKTPPSREPRSFDDEARKAAGCLDVRVDRLRELHKVVVLDRGFWLHVQDGMLGIEAVFDHVSLLYDRCGWRMSEHQIAHGVTSTSSQALPILSCRPSALRLGNASQNPGRANPA